MLVLIHGSSGAGKTLLARDIIKDLNIHGAWKGVLASDNVVDEVHARLNIAADATRKGLTEAEMVLAAYDWKKGLRESDTVIVESWQYDADERSYAMADVVLFVDRGSMARIVHLMKHPKMRGKFWEFDIGEEGIEWLE